MCEGVPIFSNNKKAFHGTGTSSHSTASSKLRIKEDRYLKSEFHWWDKSFVPDHYDLTGRQILEKNGVDLVKAEKIAREYIKNNFSKQSKIVEWLKKTPSEWGRLMTDDKVSLARKVNPKLVLYQNKIKKFKKTPIEKFNPYQATKLPSLKTIKSKFSAQVRDQVWAQVGAQVWAQVGDQVGDQVRDQVRDQVGDQVWAQVWAQVGAQVWAQVGDQVRSQVGAQVWATSYWGIKVSLGLPLKHWFFDFLKLGIMIVFVQGKAKLFGKKGKYLGEYDQKDF